MTTHNIMKCFNPNSYQSFQVIVIYIYISHPLEINSNSCLKRMQHIHIFMKNFKYNWMIDLARQLPLLITRCANMLTYSFFDGKQGDISRNVNISVRCIFVFFRTQFVSWFQRFLLVSWKISTVKRMIFFVTSLKSCLGIKIYILKHMTSKR